MQDRKPRKDTNIENTQGNLDYNPDCNLAHAGVFVRNGNRTATVHKLDEVIMALISVIMPTYNRNKTLLRAVQSVIEQNCQSWELRIIRDGCQPTCEICRETDAIIRELNDPRIILDNLRTHGGKFGTVARNYAIQKTNSKLIAYLDDDNWWSPNHLQTLLAWKTYSRASFAVSGFAAFTKDGKFVLRNCPPRLFRCGIDSSCLLHDRQLIELYGGWKEPSGQYSNFDHDWELVSRWIKAGEKFALTRNPSLHYVIHGSPARYKYSVCKNRILSKVGL
jgi:glycosyltransferase involved in cell wall biosynthesis